MEYILETNNLEKKYKDFKAISNLNIHIKKIGNHDEVQII